jgi:hypothetical protein
LVRETWAKYDTLTLAIGAAREVCVPTCDFQFVHRNDTGAADGMLVLAGPRPTRNATQGSENACPGPDPGNQRAFTQSQCALGVVTAT